MSDRYLMCGVGRYLGVGAGAPCDASCAFSFSTSQTRSRRGRVWLAPDLGGRRRFGRVQSTNENCVLLGHSCSSGHGVVCRLGGGRPRSGAVFIGTCSCEACGYLPYIRSHNLCRQRAKGHSLKKTDLDGNDMLRQAKRRVREIAQGGGVEESKLQ